MSSGVFVFDIFSTLLVAGYILYWYGNPLRQRMFVTLAVLIAWYFSFLIVVVLPLDVSSTAYKQCLAEKENVTETTVEAAASSNREQTHITNDDIQKVRNRTASNASSSSSSTSTTTTSSQADSRCEAPSSLLSEDVLPNLWRVVYWSSQLLTWIILPIMQSYTQAGEFTVLGKLRSALWDNMIFYASYLFIAVILVIYFASQPNLGLNWERTKAIAAAAGNTWGLFVLVLMLGYGLVEVPRNCWKSTQKDYQLNRSYFKVAKLMTERSDAEETLDDCLISVNAVSNIIGQSDIRRPYVEEILSKIPLEMLEKIKVKQMEKVSFRGKSRTFSQTFSAADVRPPSTTSRRPRRP